MTPTRVIMDAGLLMKVFAQPPSRTLIQGEEARPTEGVFKEAPVEH